MLLWPAQGSYKSKEDSVEEFNEAAQAKEAEIHAKAVAAGEAEADDTPPIEVEWEGETIRGYYPADNQVIFLMAQMGRGKRGGDKFSAMINVMVETLDEDSQAIVESRMLQRTPALAPEKIEELFSALSAHWTARPTE